MIEVYRTKVQIRWKSRVITTTFFFVVDNSSGSHPHRVASAINAAYTVANDWLFYLSSMVSEHAFIRLISTQRIRPSGAAMSYNAYGLTEFPGRYLGDMDDVFQCCKIRWIVDTEPTGRHMVRIGPLGVGAYQPGGWFAILELSAATFIAEHITPALLDTGDISQGCINHQTSGGSPIVTGQLMWPASRQRNRRGRC